jgi:hypothetical protein
MVLLDATGTRDTAAMELETSPNKILIISERLPKYENLTIVHINDLGLCGKNRSESKVKQIKVLTDHLRSQHDRLGVIDHLACKEENQGHWFYDNRGSNKYIGSNLLAIGTPYQDLGAIAQKYSLLTGDFDISKENPNFQNYINHLVKSEVIQVAGRPRAARTPDCKITVYLTTTTDIKYLLDYYPGCTLKTTTAFELHPYAGSREQVSRWRLLEAFKKVIETGEKCTQNILSRISELSQPYISKISKEFGGFAQLKKILLTLIEVVNRGSNIFSDLTEDEKFFANDFLPLLVRGQEETLSEGQIQDVYIVQELVELVSIVGFASFKRIVQAVYPQIVDRLISALLCLLPVPIGGEILHEI